VDEGVTRRPPPGTGYRHVCRAWHCDHAEDAPDAGPRYCPMSHGKNPRRLWPKPMVRPLTWKDLRDTAASLYLGRGVPMAVVQKVLRHADPRITSERYAHLEHDYLGAEIRKLSLIPPSKNTGQTRGQASVEGAANGDFETSVIPFPSKERRTGFEPATPSLGSPPGGLERTHGVLALPFARRRDLRTGLPEAPSGTFGRTFGALRWLSCRRCSATQSRTSLPKLHQVTLELAPQTRRFRSGRDWGQHC
jgi:hypothetical protein